jgi:hypothetical protein
MPKEGLKVFAALPHAHYMGIDLSQSSINS